MTKSQGMVCVTVDGDSEHIEASRWEEAAARMLKKHPGAKPEVTRIESPGAVTGEVNRADVIFPAPKDAHEMAAMATAPRATVSGPVIQSTRIKSAGLKMGSPLDANPGRLELARDESAAEGFAAPPPLFDRGVRVDTDASAKTTRTRQPWSALPLVVENCEAHHDRIQAEERADDVAFATGVRMMPDGSMLIERVDAIGFPVAYRVTEEAFDSLVTRVGIPSAARYLRACWPELRAHNVSGWIQQLASTEARADEAARSAGKASTYKPLDLRVRSRLAAGSRDAREIFAIVGPGYADFDADKLDQAIAMAAGDSARGRVTYDGRRSRWEIVMESMLVPKHAAIGEFFRPTVIVTTDDGGGGAIKGAAAALGSLGRNLIMVHTSSTATFDLRHVGDIEGLAKKFREGFRKAIGAMDHFLATWDLASEDDAEQHVRRMGAAGRQPLPSNGDDLMAGIFRFALENELVPVRGVKTEQAVNRLIRAWREDTSPSAGPSRAAIVTAITRWVHTGLSADVWTEDLIQSAAGMLLKRTKKDDGWAIPLGYVAPEDVKGR